MNNELIISACLAHQSSDPIAVLRDLMDLPEARMHGPEHHILVGSALLTAYKNAGGNIDLPTALQTLAQRAVVVPGAACGYWGACGAALSAGMFMSIVTNNAPLQTKVWSICNNYTSTALKNIAELGGPRCCKRNSYTAILTAVNFCKQYLGVNLVYTVPVCDHYNQNNECRGALCPYFKGE